MAKDAQTEKFTEFLESVKELMDKYEVEGFVWTKYPNSSLSAMISTINDDNVDECIKSMTINLCALHKKYFNKELPNNLISLLQVIMLGTEGCKDYLNRKLREEQGTDRTMLN